MTTKQLRANNDMFHVGDLSYMLHLVTPQIQVFRGRAYFVSDRYDSYAQNDQRDYLFQTPADKYIAVYIRSIDALSGPVELNTRVGFTSSGGTALTPVNLFTGGPASGMAVTANATLSGGVTIPNDYLYGAGNKRGAAAESGLPTIVPPSTDIGLSLVSRASGTNSIKISLAYTEIPVEEMNEILGGVT